MLQTAVKPRHGAEAVLAHMEGCNTADILFALCQSVSQITLSNLSCTLSWMSAGLYSASNMVRGTTSAVCAVCAVN